MMLNPGTIMAKQKPATQDEAEQAAKNLLAFWKIGKESWRKVDPDKKRKGDEVEYAHGHKLDLLHAEAERTGLNHDTLSKGWKLGREYSREQIDELCDLVIEHRARFSGTHLTRLLAVENREKRDALARTAIEKHWGVTTLERKIQASKGIRRALVGNKPLIPTTRGELLMALGSLCDKWDRWCSAAGTKLPSELEKKVDVATTAVLAVKTAINEMLKPKKTLT